MITSTASLAGESRSCPHCKSIILKSATTCPLCRHNLRFQAIGAGPVTRPTNCAFLVEGAVKNRGDDEALEYFILMEVRDDAGKLISRQSVGVGAIRRAENRIFSLRVELTPANRPD
jgi:hypothetical protein